MISRSLGSSPSKVAINNKARKQGWERLSERLPVGRDGNTLVIPAELDPRRKAALKTLSDGGNYRDAALAATVSESTFREWRQNEEFRRLCEAAVSGLKLEMLGYVKQGASRDPKYAAWLLQHHPETRGDFGAAATPVVAGNTFNVLAHVKTGIVRDRPVIEGEVENEPA